MKEVFKIAEFDSQGKLRLKTQEFTFYADAVRAIEQLPSGTYQAQRVFIKD